MAEPIDISADVAPIDPNAVPDETNPDEISPPENDLPDEVLQIPSIQAIMAGAPPAVSFSVEAASKTPEAKLIGKNKQSLQENGVGFYRSLAGDIGVLFNSLKISGEDIIAADKAGKLLEVAPDATKVSQDILASGSNHPALSAGAPNSTAAAPTANVPPQSAQMPMTGSSPANRQRLAAQLKNLQPGAPTQGTHPGAGRLLASIMKPVL